jgi:NAD(P)-dependent dehydrogenase (short-subunit alcohol dehydrogenase family)
MVQDLFSVSGKVVVLTGGLGQLGRQFTTALLDRGARVAVFDSAAAEGSDPAPDHENLMILPADVTRRASIDEALETVVARWDVPDGLVNCAALDSPPDAPAEENGPFETYPEESWERVMEVNAKGVFLCCQAVGGKMAAAGRGTIVNISSIYALVSPDQRLYGYRSESGDPFFKPAAYGASKSAVLNMTRYLATYWAGSGVRVNALSLGGIYNGQDETFLENYGRRVPLGRMAREEEYCGALIFLVSDTSSYMTGSNLVIDGGWTAW